MKRQDQKESRPLEQVAAICYRSVNNSTEYLLVRARSGRWTFPKGAVESDEERWSAAEREAFEEAGVTGVISHESMTTYLHAKKAWEDKGRETMVHAFLLKVKKTQIPEEQYRNPTWFSFSAAEDALVEGRPSKYAEELQRVLREANSRLPVNPFNN
jgi:8-oxo-dGTP pyrophosphatase MutT (NUDIX family)